MKIITVTEKDRIEYEAEGIIACIIKPKGNGIADDEEQPDSASMVVGICGRHEIVVRAAASLSSIIDHLFPNVMDNASARDVARTILEEQSSTYMRSDVKRSDIHPVKEKNGKE